MSVPIYSPEERPEEISHILNTLQRYNRDTIPVLQEYVSKQCSSNTYDFMANIALLKLYQLNPDLLVEEHINDILAKSLTSFSGPDFSLCLHLLPPYVLVGRKTNEEEEEDPDSENDREDTDDLSESVRKLYNLYVLLDKGRFPEFWRKLSYEDLGRELVYNVVGFDEAVRSGIANVVAFTFKEISLEILEKWLNLKGEDLQKFIVNFGWKIVDQKVIISQQSEPEVKQVTSGDTFKIEQLSKLVRHAYETETVKV